MKKLLLISSIALLTYQINAQCFPSITNETVTASQNTVCIGQSSTISIGASLPGVKYYLRDNTTNTVVAGPSNGNGGPLAFNTGSLAVTKTFHIYGETQPGGNVALDFDGSNDMIYTDTYPVATNSLTIEAWIYPRATSYKRILSNYKATTFVGQFGFDTYAPTNNGRGLRLFLVGGASITTSVTISNVLTLNTWNHVAGTFDNGVMRLYVNGIAVATSTAPFTSLAGSTNEITIGEDPSIITAEYFNGMIDDVRIWTTARTASEISTNMTNCLVGNEAGLKNYWKLFENSGTKILDIVTNSVGTMGGGMSATAWTSGNVNCGTATCNLIMTNLKTITVSACTGLAELSSTNAEVIVYPNPTNSTLTIKTEETIETATVYNLLGSVVLEETNKSFSVEQLPAGVYTLQIKTANGIGTVRFVKE
jgi:hypothetical protein